MPRAFTIATHGTIRKDRNTLRRERRAAARIQGAKDGIRPGRIYVRKITDEQSAKLMRLRHDGLPWPVIGREMNMTAQAARSAYVRAAQRAAQRAAREGE